MGNMAATIHREKNAVREVYNEDIRERKSMAIGARHMRAGSTRQFKPSFAHDDITRKEWEKMNGNVKVTYAPMSLAEYKKKTDIFKSKYIGFLRRSFAASPFMISKMLCGSHDAADLVRTDIRALVKRGFDCGPKTSANTPSEEMAAKWNSWLESFNWTDGLYELKAEQASSDVEAPKPQTHAEPEPAEKDNTDASRDSVDLVPVDYKTFMRYSIADKAAYIGLIREEFGASDRLIGPMMGTSAQTICTIRNECIDNGFTFPELKSGHRNTTSLNYAKWNAWLTENQWTKGLVNIPAPTPMPKKKPEPQPVATDEDHEDRVRMDAIRAAHGGKLSEANTHDWPMSIDDYIKMSDVDRYLYLLNLRERFGVGDRLISRMMNGSKTKVYDDRLKLMAKFGEYPTLSLIKDPKKIGDWNQWLTDHGCYNALIKVKDNTLTQDQEDSVEETIQEDDALMETHETVVAPENKETPKLPSFSWEMKSGDNPDALIDWIRAGIMFLGNKDLTITISVKE